MNHLKTFSAALLTAVALLTLAGSASATTLTSPAGTTYTGAFHVESGTIEFHGPFTTIVCKKSTFAGKVENHGAGITAGGKLSSFTLSECNYPMTTLKAGSIEIHSTGSGNGTLTWSGGEITWESSIANCILTTAGTDLGTLTGGSPAKLDINSAGIPRTGHSFFCGQSSTWTGSFTFTTPSTLLVD
jgi:phage baseplate assembly protein gpV